jgi:hypothetical protein
MEWLRRWGGRFRAADAALSWAERAYLVYMVGLSTIVSAVFGVITWILQNFVYGLLAFFGVWTLVTALQAFRVIKRPTSTGETEHEVEQVRDGSGVPGIPEHMIAERHIRYHENPIRLVDLLEVTGEGGVLRDFQFDHCILEGPGIINIQGPFPKPEHDEPRAALSVGPADCRVEGSPDTTLYQIGRDGKMPVGVIHLPGYTLQAVTFRSLGFAGTPEHLAELQKRLKFSEGD